jgi:hypothetical protein
MGMRFGLRGRRGRRRGSDGGRGFMMRWFVTVKMVYAAFSLEKRWHIGGVMG